MFSVVLSVGLCVAVSDLKNEDIAKLDCLLFLPLRFVQNKGVRMSLHFYEKGASFENV